MADAVGAREARLGLTEGRDGSEASEEDLARALKLWVVLARAHDSVQKLVEADISRHGLTTGEFGALEALYHKGPLLLSQLQQKILLSSGGITYVVDRLQKKGLVTRRPCPRDRRATYAEITDEGRARMDRIFPLHARAVSRALGGLEPGEQEKVVRLLRDLGHHAASLDPAPPADDETD